ncbi:MAG TPA: ATP-binding cassette domain-containing protein, partial [Alphaproteobacteria bacterium]|nr:ATP-binding cassette domain-containing protein [Alphaproteobacteria bacterium]
LQIEPLLDRKPAQLSGGQRQRVAIGRALVKNVGLFLFDEPLSNLDAKLRTEMRLEIKKLHDALKSTIVYVTHDQIEAMTMATKIAVMDGGVIQQVGTPDEIYSRPRNLFVAGFIGSPAMNLRRGRIVAKNGHALAEVDGLTLDLAQYGFETRPEDGQPIIVGLRPEHFGGLGEGVADKAATFELPVQYTEKTGGDATGYLRLGEDLLAVRIDPERIGQLRQGDAVKVEFPQGKLHLFDAQTGLRL